MKSLNELGQNLVKEVGLATKYSETNKNKSLKTSKTTSTLAIAYERARNAVEYRDEHLIRQAAIERILKRRLFLNQSTEKIANLLTKELVWARYIESDNVGKLKEEKFKNIIQKYREALLLIPSSKHASTIIGLCACEIDEALNFEPLNQIIINFVSSTLEKIIIFDEQDKATKSIQIYIATERSFSKNSEILIKYKLLKVLLPKWSEATALFRTLDKIDEHLNYKYKDLVRRKVGQLSPPFNLIKDLVIEHADEFIYETNNVEKLKLKIKEVLDQKYAETKSKVVRASTRSIIYIFLTKMILAMLIEIPFDIIFGSINYLVLSINILFPPSLMILFNSRVKLPQSNNTTIMVEKITDYLYSDLKDIPKEEIIINNERTTTETVFYYAFLSTSILVVIGIIALLSIRS